MARTGTLRIHWRVKTSEYLTWHLLFDGQPRMREAAARYQRTLAGIGGIDVVPARWLHLTVQGVGSADELPTTEVDALVGAARKRLADLQPIRLTFQPAEVQWEGITLTATPAEPISAVRQALRGVIAAVRGADRVPDADAEPFWPHVSLAYANSAVPADALIDAVASAHGQPFEVEVGQAALIRLRREGRRYVWSVEATVQLGHRKPAANVSSTSP